MAMSSTISSVVDYDRHPLFPTQGILDFIFDGQPFCSWSMWHLGAGKFKNFHKSWSDSSSFSGCVLSLIGSAEWSNDCNGTWPSSWSLSREWTLFRQTRSIEFRLQPWLLAIVVLAGMGQFAAGGFKRSRKSDSGFAML